MQKVAIGDFNARISKPDGSPRVTLFHVPPDKVIQIEMIMILCK
jgi:hypothetical protein